MTPAERAERERLVARLELAERFVEYSDNAVADLQRRLGMEERALEKHRDQLVQHQDALAAFDAAHKEEG